MCCVVTNRGLPLVEWLFCLKKTPFCFQSLWFANPGGSNSMPSQSRSSVQRTHSLPVHTSPQTMLMFQQQGVTGGPASAAYLSPTPPLYRPPRSAAEGSGRVLEAKESKRGRCLFRCVQVESPDVLLRPACMRVLQPLPVGRARSPRGFIWNAAAVCSSGPGQRTLKAPISG